jgi:hypothetical protein
MSVAVLAASVALVAQKRPNFSGTWTLDPDRSQMGGGRGPGGWPGGMGGPMSITIKQTDAELVISRDAGGRTSTQTFKLDGSETVHPGMRGGEVKSKSRWEGDKIVTESTQSMSTPNGEVTFQSKEVRSIAEDGSMVVENTRTTPRGTQTAKLVFKKTT